MPSLREASISFALWLRKRNYESELGLILDALQVTKSDLVLDIGAGPGLLANGVAERCDEVFALEPVRAFVDYCRRKFPQVKAFASRAESIPFPERYFTKIYAFSSFHHFGDQDLAINEMNRVMKPEGLLLIREPNSRSFGSRLEARVSKVKFETPSEIEEKLQRGGFEIAKSGSAPRGGFYILATKKKNDLS